MFELQGCREGNGAGAGRTGLAMVRGGATSGRAGAEATRGREPYRVRAGLFKQVGRAYDYDC